MMEIETKTSYEIHKVYYKKEFKDKNWVDIDDIKKLCIKNTYKGIVDFRNIGIELINSIQKELNTCKQSKVH